MPRRARQLCPAAHRHLCSSSATPSWHNWRARTLRRHSIRWAFTAVRVWVGQRTDHRRRTVYFEASQQLLQPCRLGARQVSVLARIISTSFVTTVLGVRQLNVDHDVRAGTIGGVACNIHDLRDVKEARKLRRVCSRALSLLACKSFRDV